MRPDWAKKYKPTKTISRPTLLESDIEVWQQETCLSRRFEEQPLLTKQQVKPSHAHQTQMPSLEATSLVCRTTSGMAEPKAEVSPC